MFNSLTKITILLALIALTGCSRDNKNIFEFNEDVNRVASQSHVDKLRIPPSYYIKSSDIDSGRVYISDSNILDLLLEPQSLQYLESYSASLKDLKLSSEDKKFLALAGIDDKNSNDNIRPIVNEETYNIVTAKKNVMRKILFLSRENNEALEVKLEKYNAKK